MLKTSLGIALLIESPQCLTNDMRSLHMIRLRQFDTNVKYVTGRSAGG